MRVYYNTRVNIFIFVLPPPLHHTHKKKKFGYTTDGMRHTVKISSGYEDAASKRFSTIVTTTGGIIQ